MTTLTIGQTVTAQNPGGRRITGRYVGAGRYPGTIAVEWTGAWFFDGARRYVGTFPADSAEPVQ